MNLRRPILRLALSSVFVVTVLTPSTSSRIEGEQIRLAVASNRGLPSWLAGRQSATVLDVAALDHTRVAAVLRTSRGARELIIADFSEGKVTATVDLTTQGVLEPIGVAATGQDEFVVLDARGAVVSQFQLRDGKIVRSATVARLALARTSDICVLEGGPIILGQKDAFVPGDLLHPLTPTLRLGRPFAAPFGTGDALTRTVFGSGFLHCDRVAGHVVVASQLYGELRAYRASGDLLWSAALPNFQRVSVDQSSPGTVRYRLPSDSIWNRVVALFSPEPNVIAVQVATHYAFDSQNALRGINTYFLDERRGRLIGSQSDLSAVLAIVGATLIGVEKLAARGVDVYASQFQLTRGAPNDR